MFFCYHCSQGDCSALGEVNRIGTDFIRQRTSYNIRPYVVAFGALVPKTNYWVAERIWLLGALVLKTNYNCLDVDASKTSSDLLFLSKKAFSAIINLTRFLFSVTRLF